MRAGYMGKLMEIDLDTGRAEPREIDEKILRQFLGGRGLGAKLLFDSAPDGVDPLSPENPLVFATGPLTGTAAFGSSGSFCTVSPLTGAFLDSGVRGHFSAAVKLSGFDALVIRGKSKKPVYVFIENGKAEVRDATGLWGKDAFETVEAITGELPGQHVHVAAIGPAGENLVRFACISADKWRQAGRGGAGAVMGSKNLKAIAARAQGQIPVSNPKALLEDVKALVRLIHENAEPLRSQGTLWLVDPMNDFGMLPTRNFRSGVFELASNLNASYMERKAKVRNAACYGCALCCSNLTRSAHPKFGPITIEGPEYETVALLGSNCNVGSFEDVAYLNSLCDRLGLDTMSSGAVCSFLMELLERGILSESDVGYPLAWGDAEGIARLLEDIAYRRGIGNLLAEGSRRASLEIGGEAPRFAMHVKGMELPGYDPRGAMGMALAYATSDRGACHLRAWTIYEEVMGDLDRYSPVGKAALVAARQNRKMVMDSLGICEQLGLMPIFGQILSHLTGWKVDLIYNATYPKLLEDFSIEGEAGVGDRAYTLTRLFNVKRGLSRANDTLPPRFFEEPLQGGPTDGRKVNRGDFEKMLSEFYSIRGWDEEGRPTPEKLRQLELS